MKLSGQRLLHTYVLPLSSFQPDYVTDDDFSVCSNNPWISKNSWPLEYTQLQLHMVQLGEQTLIAITLL
jgi:hypothetical protein